jgi:translation initiation factor IF-2
MGHIDHGKSTLLDYIRKTKVAESEAGGITQHISAYEVEHESGGEKKKITFLDTPGHEAFQKMRSRGSAAADIAILVVSAEDGVKPQTLEALEAIKAAGTPYVVAITKIDRPNANVDRAKSSLIESGIYLEGLGGDISYVPISSKSGEGIPDLLDTLLLLAELQELKGDPNAPAEGIVIESHRDPKRGISATLLIKNGTLHSGKFVVAGHAWAPLRMIEDFAGHPVDLATFSSPVTIIGFTDVPPVGSRFAEVETKKEAEQLSAEAAKAPSSGPIFPIRSDIHEVPVVIKADVAGSLEAIRHELRKQESDRAVVKIVAEGVGTITEADIKSAGTTEGGLVIGFNVEPDSAATEWARRLNVEIATFSIIYKLAEWLETAVKDRIPAEEVEERVGAAKVLKVFSKAKHVQLIGGRVEEGQIAKKSAVTILRRGEKIGMGHVVSLQQLKSSVDSLPAGEEFGAQIDSRIDLAPGDMLESFVVVVR